ncbi:hypothetical protein FQA39_LY06923 [Lamprigera yunnana]|nr:hypothetical protein FQA39_LY06923 [Lamprigera yunnana]
MMETSTESIFESEPSEDELKIVLESPKRKLKKMKPSNKFEPEEMEFIDTFEKELEENLDAKAAKINLSTTNVKTILREVVTNEHVLALVRQGENPQAPSVLPFEPKLTRAKAKELGDRELHHMPPISSIPWISQTKPSSEVQKLITDELAEDSSGDEYVPIEEESEDDPDNSVITETKQRSVSSSTPAKEPQSPNEVNFTDNGIFKILPNKQNDNGEEANIALRTRSKLCLSSTPLEVIEEAFIPPDITTDMYDMDCDDVEWRDFLKTFTRPLDEIIKPSEDEEQDPEYNILADEAVDKVDREELRADKAVKVSRKELNDMIAELFECANNNFEDNQEENVNLINTSTESQTPVTTNHRIVLHSNVELQNVPTSIAPSKNCNISNLEPSSDMNFNCMLKVDQKLLLEQQIRQQVQLLTQNFILTYQNPEYNELAVEFKSILYNYKCLVEVKENSILNSCNLKGALDLIQYWETQFQLNTDEIKVVKEYVCKVLHESITSKKAGIEYIVTFPPLVMDLIAKSEVFIYPDLLPMIPFKSSALFSKKLDTYTTCEDQLIALGLEKFVADLSQDSTNFNGKGEVNLKKLCLLIKTYLTPTKDLMKLYYHVLNSNSLKSSANPIKYYYETKRAPVVIHYVRNLSEYGIVPPCKRKKEMLPYQWQLHLYPNTLQNNGSQFSSNTITKVQRPPAYNKSFSGKTSTKKKAQRSPCSLLQHSTPSVCNRSSTPINANISKNRLDTYFASPKISKLEFINSRVKSLKFNSSIFQKLKKKSNKMLPSMPALLGNANSDTDVMDSSLSKPTILKSTFSSCNTECGDAVIELDEKEVIEKDNEEDINALMVASSTIKTNNANRKSLSASEKKRVKLRREYLANLTMLSPDDPVLLQEKAQHYAQAYFDKVRDHLQPEKYECFMDVLNNFEGSTRISELYNKIEEVMGEDHKDLMEEFLTFLTPTQARDIGKLIPYYMISNMSLFLQKLEIYFKEQPAQLRKIYKSLTYLTTCVNINMDLVKSTIVPLLKGNALLTDWFVQIFPCEPPPPSLLQGVWEEIDARRDFNASEDIFETVTVPEMEEEYGGVNCICTCYKGEDLLFKSKSQHCIPCGIKFFQGRIYVQTGKGPRLAYVTFPEDSTIDHNVRLNGTSLDKRKRRCEISPSKQFTSPVKDSHEDMRLANDSEEDTECTRKKGRLTKSPRKKKVKCRNLDDKIPSSEPTETQIDICDRNFTTSNLESKIESVENQNTLKKPEDDSEWDCNAAIKFVENKHSPDHSAGSESEFCEESSQDNINTETDDSAEELESLSNSPVHSENSNSNLPDEDITWTRDEDKIILETMQKEGGKDEAFTKISKILETRSILQIRERFQILMNFLQKLATAS